ncbi:chemotaxis protein, partial [Vibrio vulnificus]
VTESMNLSNNQFAQSAIETNAVLAGTMLEEFSSSNSENLQMLAGLAGNQANQNAENLKAIKELAQFNKDGGQAKQSEMNLYLLFFIAAVLGFVTYKAVR